MISLHLLSKQFASFFNFLILLTMVVSTHSLMGQTDSARFNSEYISTKRLISVENGLASHEVFCGVQDAAGFLWFGTRNGLNRYDGKNCLLFTRQRNKLQENKVVQLARDDANQLFIQYGSAGFQLRTNGRVDVMDATTQQVQTLTAAFPKLPFKEQDVYWIANDGTGEVSFLTAFPFRYWRYSSKTGFKLRFEMKDWDAASLNVDHRTTGPVCAFVKGRALLKINNQEKQYLVAEDRDFVFQQHQVLRSLPIGFSSKKELLITYNTKDKPDAFTVDKLTDRGELVPVSDLNQYNLGPVNGRYWFQVCVSTGGTASMFYIPTDGLYLWNKQAFVKVLDKSELKGFENLFIYQLIPDSLGNLWVCTSHGVVQLTLKKNRFKLYFSTTQQSIEPNGQARGIYADERGRVGANIWTHTFTQQGGQMQFVKHEAINYALVKHGSSVYSGGYGLSLLSEAGSKAKLFSDGLGSEIWSMLSLNDSLIILGRSAGFSLFNSNTNRFDSLPMATATSPAAKFVYRFLRDKNQVVWAVAEDGLYKLSSLPPGGQRSGIGQRNIVNGGRPVGLQWSMVKLKSSFLNGLSLLDAYQDTEGVFWLATNGEGLYRWDPKTNASRQFNITAGFPSDVLYRIETDVFKNLWISSDYGLIRFNTKTFSVNTYTTDDGISHNEFNRTSSFKGADGKLFFGGLNGVNGFDPREFRTDIAGLRVPLKIIGFNQFVASKNELVDRTAELLRDGKIVLEPNDRFFTLDFQLLDFTKDEGHRYAYQIEGLEPNWNYINENSLRVSGLPSGDFVLRVRAQNREGAWNKDELSIPLKVLKPVYLQWWFVLAIATMLVFIVYLLIRFRLKQTAWEKERLEETVNERTIQLRKSLSEQSALLLEKDILMKEIHHRVKNNLQVISGLLELQSKSLKDETAREVLREGRSRVRSIALIHQNLYQFENLSAIDLKQFVNDLSQQVQSVFQKQKPVNIMINVSEQYLDIDSAVPLGLLLNELLSNSFKYAFADVTTGEIILEIRSTGEGRYRLLYSDNGPGLPTDFDFAKATTLGLQLVSDLSRQIGGRVQYAMQDSATFTINFTNRDVRKKED